MSRRYSWPGSNASLKAMDQTRSSRGLIFLIIVLTIILIAQAALAQNVSNYGPVVRNTSVTYSSIASTGTSFSGWQNGTNTDDNRTYPTNIGFTFYYMGQSYTTFSIGVNGLLDFANVTPPSFVSGPYSSDNTTFSSSISPSILAVAPLYDDLWVTGDPQTQAALDANFKYQLSGTAPNRILTVEWMNLQEFGATTGALNFQVKLYETVGKIEFIYGTMTPGSATYAYTLGINGLTMSATPQAHELLTLQNTTTWAFDSLAMNTLATLPSAGDQFVFTPLYTTSPAAPITLAFTNVGQTAMQVNWVDNSTTETGFFVYQSTDNVNFTRIGVVLSSTRTTTATGYNIYVTGLSPSTTYYYRISAANEGSAQSSYLTGSQATNSSCSMSGTYSVGPGGTYSSLTSAFAALAGNGLGGAVVLELKAAYASTVESFPITIGAIPCASASNTVTVRPESGATGLEIVNSVGGTITLDLNGVDYLVFDGRPGGAGTSKELTIHNNLTTGIAIRFINDALNNIFRYCRMRGANTSTTAGVIVFSTTNATNGNDNNTIEQCDIYDSPAGTPAVCLYSVGTTTTIPQYNSGNTVNNCNVFNYFQAASGTFGISLGSGNTGWTISNTRLYQESARTFTAGTTHYGIYISPGANGSGFIVNNNKIGNNTSYQGGPGTGKYTLTGAGTTYQSVAFIGIYCSVGSGGPSNVQGDTLRDIDFTTGSTSTTAFIGIQVAAGNVNIGTTTPCIIGSDAPSSTGSITFTFGNAAANATGGGLIGIYNTGSGAVNISSNSIASILTRPDPAIVSYSSTTQLIGIQSTAGTVTISGNQIGEASTANSIQCAAGTFAGTQALRGIYVTGATACAISNNLVQQCANAYNLTAAGQVIGIQATSGTGISIVGNTVRNLSNAANYTGSTTSAAVIGISQQSTSASSMTVSQNVVHSLSNTNAAASSTYMYGLYFTGPTSFQNLVSRNAFHSFNHAATSATNYMYGMYIAGGTDDVVNNMVRLGINTSGTANAGYYLYGIYDASASNSNFDHNTVYIGGPDPAATYNPSYAFFRSGAGVDNVRNNIFDNNRGHNTTGTGSHFAYYLSTTTTITSDYNLYKASGKGHCLAYAAANRLTLQDLRANLAGQDLHSAAYLAGTGFVDSAGAASTTDLHLAGATPAEGAGFALGTVTDDFDGAARAGLSPADIGADAGSFTAVDVFTPMITYTALANTSSTANRTLGGVAITDQGTGVPTTGGSPDYRPRIWFRKSSGTPSSWYSNNGTLNSGTGTSGTWDMVIDYSLIPAYTPAAGDVIQYYVVAQDQAAPVNIGYYPFNATTPVHPDVNTQTTASAVPSSYTILGSTPLSGTVTVGSAGTYPTLTGVGGLFEAINLNGLSGNLTAQVISSTTEDGTNALNQWVEAGAGNYTLSIVPDAATLRELTGNVSTASGMIRLNGADRVSIDGRYSGSGQYLLFRNSNTTQPTLAFLNDATYNTLQNCFVEGASTASTGMIYFGTGVASGNSNNNITGCEIRDLTVGSGQPAYAVYSLGQTSPATAANQNITITNNNISNFFAAAATSAGIYLSSGSTAWTISGNKFFQSASRTFTGSTSHYGIWISNTSGNGFAINSNTFGYSSSGGTGVYTMTASSTTLTPVHYAIFLTVGTALPSSVQGNTIAAISHTSASATALYGIYVSAGIVNVGNVSGNTIGDASTGSITLNTNSTAGSTTTAHIYGMYYAGTAAVIANNAIGSISTVPVTPASNVGSIVGIYSSSANNVISGNTIGHASTANSISAGTTSSTSYQIVRGIWTASASTVMNNLVANLSSAHSGTSTSSQVMGFYNTSGSQTLIGNTIRNLTSASANAAAVGSTSSVIGAYFSNGTTSNNISGNTIHTLVNTHATAAVTVLGMYISFSTGTPYGFVQKNFIHSFTLSSSSTTAGIAGMYIVGGTTNYQNNMIRLGIDDAGNGLANTYGITGIWKATTGINYLYNNSVYIGGSGVGAGTTNTYAFYRASVGADIIQNNIFSNERSNGAGTGKHYAIYHAGTTVGSCDYNLYRASGTGAVLAFITADRASLQALRENFSGQDLHSGVGDPGFAVPAGSSATVDLHLTGTTPAEGAGMAIATVTDDFDSQGRAGLTPTDLGADAGSFTALDVFTPFITYTVLGPTTSTSNRTLSGVTITDVSTGVPITGGSPDYRPRIWYRKSSGTPTAWASNNGTLTSGSGLNGQWSFVVDYSLIPAYTPAPGDVIQYYIVAQDQATPVNVWYNPFAGASHSDVNTQTTAPASPNSYTIQPTVITVGTGGTFTDLTGAAGFFNWVNSNTLSENLTVQIISDITEPATNGLNQWAESGVGGYTITISDDGSPRTLSCSAANDMIRLNGADRVTINGGGSKNLTFKQTNVSYATILFTNDARNNTIQNCNIEGQSTSASKGTITFTTAGGTTLQGNDLNMITQCNIRNVSGFNPIQAIYSSGTTTPFDRMNSNNTVSNNNIYNYFHASSTSYGINLTSGNTEWTISGNNFYQDATLTFTAGVGHYAVYISNATGNNFSVTNNIIGYASSSQTGKYTTTSVSTPTIYGIYLSVGTVTATSVQNNTIAGYDVTSASTATPWYGLYVAAGSVDVGTVTGNTIGDAATGSVTFNATASGSTTYGMYFATTGNVNISNNAIGALTTVGSSTLTANLVGLQLTSSGGYTASNNTIGHASTANSLNASANVSGGTALQSVIGIRSSATAAVAISGNTVANLANAYAGTTAGTAMLGIQTTSGLNVISGNSVRNLTASAPTTGAGTSASLVGISQSSTSTPQIVSQNLVHSLSNSSATGDVMVIGLAYSGPTTGASNAVARNFVHSLNLSTAGAGTLIGIHIIQGALTVENNMVRLGIDAAGSSITTPYGINGILRSATSATVPMNFWHNSVYLGGSGVSAGGSSTYAFRRTTNGTDDIRNNIFANDRSNSAAGGTHYAYVLNSTVTTTSDYNIYRAGGTGGVLASVNSGGTALTTVQQLRENFPGADLNSGTGNPNFALPAGSAATVDLHLASPTPAEGAGIAVVTTIDYDGALRSGASPTDIGADAGSFSAIDNFTPNIDYTPLTNTGSTANRTLPAVTISDAGTGVPLSGANAPRIWYRKNAGTWVSNAGTNTGGTGNNGVWDFVIDYSVSGFGGAPSAGDVIYYYVVAQDQATTPNVWYNPFIGANHSNVNTQTSAPTTPNSYLVGGSFSGTINVGTGQTYTSLTNTGGLFEAINSGSLSGNVTVNVVSDITETGTNALNPWTETGGGGYTLTIGPDGTTERVLSGDVTLIGGMIRLNGADRVSFDGRYSGSGKYLRFRNQSSFQPTFTLFNDATNNTIRNCTIEGGDTSNVHGVITIGQGTASGNVNNTITNCDIRDVSTITAYPRNLIHSRGNNASYAQFNAFNTISNNNFYNNFIDGQTAICVKLDTASTEYTVTGNSFYQTVTRTSVSLGPTRWQGIYTFEPLGGNILIQDNYFGGTASNTGGSPMTFTTTNGTFTQVIPINIGAGSSTAQTSIQGNIIRNMNITFGTQSAVVMFAGIFSAGSNALLNIGNVSGNWVGDTTGTNSIVINILGSVSPTLGMIFHQTAAGSCMNNKIGAITVDGTNTATVTLYGISAVTQLSAINISGNVIGSFNTANSFQVPVSAAAMPVQFYGISSSQSTGGSTTLSNNLVANLANNSAHISSGLVGIRQTTSPATVQGNTIFNLSSAGSVTGGGTFSAVLGLGLSFSTGPNTVSQNRIYNLWSTQSAGSPGCYAQGLYVTLPSSLNTVIERNIIHGLSVASANPTANILGIWHNGGSGTFQNNIVRVGVDGNGSSITTENTIYGMLKSPTSNTNIYHNTILVGGTGVGPAATNSFAFYRSGAGNPDDVRDNIFVNTRSNAGGLTGGKHYAYYLASTATLISDANIYRVNPAGGGVLAFAGADRATIQTLRENLPGQDLYSGTGDPNFVNSTGTWDAVDLHVQSPTPVEAAGLDIPIVGDWDGDVRSANTPTDIGADAGPYSTNATTDIFTPNIAFTPLGNTPSTSNRTFGSVLITDVGTGVPTAGGSVPRVWFKNMTKASAWSSTAGSIISGTGNSGQWTFTIDYSLAGGTPSFGDVIQYYIVAQDQATGPNVWYQPYAGALHASVSIQTAPPSAPLQYTISGSTLSGTYNVGAGQTYTSLTNPGGLFEAINNGALSGNVTASIISDINELGTYGLSQWSETGGGGYTLTIQPDAAVERLLYGDVAITDGMIRLNGADRVTIDGRFSGSGRYLRFRNMNLAQPVITLINDATNNTIRNANIESNHTTTVIGAVRFSTGIVTGNDNNTVTQCVIRDRTDVTSSPMVYGMVSTGTSTIVANSENTVSDNEFVNCLNYGFYTAAAGTGGNWTITGNSFYYNHAATASTTIAGIYFAPGTGSSGNTISGNFIGGQAASCGGSAWLNNYTSTAYGIYVSVGPSPFTSIQNNTVQNLYYYANSSQSWTGIHVAGGACSIGSVTGNTLGHGSTANSILSLGTGLMRGIYYGSAETGIISNNLIANITMNTYTSGTSGLRGMEATSPPVLTVIGNTIRNLTANSNSTGSTNEAAVYGIYSSSTSAGMAFDNNLIHSLVSSPFTSTTNTWVIGINLAGGIGSASANTIYNLVNNSSGSTPVTIGALVTSGAYTVANNMIALGDGVSVNAVMDGIRDGSTTSSNYYYNSIALSGTVTSGGNVTHAFNRTSTAPLTLTNNILHNERGGGGGAHYAIGNTSATPATGWTSATSNYNLLVSPNASLVGEFGTTAPVNRSFSGWKTSAGSDAFSLSDISAIVPASTFFAGPSTGNLHLATGNAVAWYANGNGIALAPIATDFDNNGRNTTVAGGTTDIGADEMNPTVGPAGIVQTPVLGGTSTFTFGGRTLATIDWGTGGTVPSSVTLFFNPGETPPSPSGGNYSDGYWNFTASGGSGYTYTMNLYYTPAMIGTIPFETSIRMAKRDASWVHYPTSVVNQSTKTVTQGSLTTFSDFALSDASNPLPVQLVSFVARLNGSRVDLAWRTVSEFNTLRFVVERSIDRMSWEEIGSVAARGAVDAPMSYAWADEHLPAADAAYYRLRIVDRDGTYEHSAIERVSLKLPKSLVLEQNYPNPFNAGTRITFALPEESFVNLTVYDMTGREVRTLVSEVKPAGVHVTTFDPADLPSGLYRCVINAGGGQAVIMMSLLR